MRFMIHDMMCFVVDLFASHCVARTGTASTATVHAKANCHAYRVNSEDEWPAKAMATKHRANAETTE